MGPKMPTVSLACYTKDKQPDGDVSSAIRNSLSVSLSGNQNGFSGESNIQNQLVASTKRALVTHVDYEEVKQFSNSVQDLKTKYILLKPQMGTIASATITSNYSNGKPLLGGVSDKITGTAIERRGAELPTPKQILYPRDKIKIGWKATDRKWVPGAGMINVGNTCYLNSTLQALFHVPSFANWLISDATHRETCEEKSGSQNGCIICAVAKTLICSQQSAGQAIKPYLVYTKLKLICKHLVFGQQEDAHEFLRYLMEAMEKAYLARIPKSVLFDQHVKETTPINQILGGYLKTSVHCLACSHESVTFQHFEDLLLDIRKVNTLEEALDLYFARERLEDMGYKCEACKKKASATKQFSLERAPISLCIQLKRFSIVGNKLNKHIAIRQHLNLSKYSSRKMSNEILQYRLVSMVTHLGASQHCGHYTAIGLTDTGSYYQFDDSFVRQISIQNVLNTNAYIIFYELDSIATKSNAFNNIGDTIKLHLDDRLGASGHDYLNQDVNKDLTRNVITQTVTSSSATKSFIGPLLPSKLNNESNDIIHTFNDLDNESILGNKYTNHHKTNDYNSMIKLTNHNENNVHSSTINSFVQNNVISLNLLNNDNDNNDDHNHKHQNDHNHDHDRNNCNGNENTNFNNDNGNGNGNGNDINDHKLNGHNNNNIKNNNNNNNIDDDDDDEDNNNNNNNNNNNDDDDAENMHSNKIDLNVIRRSHKEQTLPSMPKLESNDLNEHSNINNIRSSSSSSSSSSTLQSTILLTNGNSEHIIALDESNSSSNELTIKNQLHPMSISKSHNSTAVLLVNGNSNNRLVPYDDDDSEYDSGNESPPEVITKAGPFQVTNTMTPSVVSTFLKCTNDSSASAVQSTTELSNGAKLLSNRHESDSTMMIKTIASSNTNKRPNEWHGHETKHKLLKQNHRGYGGTVTKWNGQKSTIEKEVEEEKNEEIKRQMLNASDAEMDRGNKKKTGSKLVLSRDNPGYNTFQECQNNRYNWLISNGTNSNSANLTRMFKAQIFRQNPHKNKFQNNFKRGGNTGRSLSNGYNRYYYNRQMNK